MAEDPRTWHAGLVCRHVATAMKERNFDACVARDRHEARAMVMAMIPEGSRIGLGGSMTLAECGILEALAKEEFEIINPQVPGQSREVTLEQRRQALLADVFLSGANAITRDGKIVNVDGLGNRVAALTYGPKKVILVVGANKVVDSVEAGFRRVADYAAPVNCERLDRPNPCRQTGKCEDCSTETRICNHFSVMMRSHEPDRITVVLVAETLGF